MTGNAEKKSFGSAAEDSVSGLWTWMRITSLYAAKELRKIHIT
jgi:hypothetical protein